MKRFAIPCMTAIVLSFANVPAFALTGQSNAPIRIQSDTAELNAEKNYAIYSGDVVVTQNGTQLKADKVLIYRNNGDLHKIEAFGKPAQFNQPADATNPEIFAYGNTITYSRETEVLKLEQGARFVQANNSISGDTIEYDTRRRVAKASGNKTSKERVDIIFNPTPKADTSGANTPMKSSTP